METLSRSEFVHFVIEKLSQFPEEQQEGAQRWTFDEQKFLLRKGATDFSLSAPFEKYSALTDKSAQDEYFKNLVDVIRWIAKGNSAELNFDSIKDKLFPTIRMTIYYDAINKTYSPEDQRINIAFPGSAELRVGFFMNTTEDGTSVTAAHQKAWAKTDDELLTIALHNLNAITPRPPQWRKGDAVYEADWNDEFAAARLLLPDLFDRKYFPQTYGDIVVTIPADDKLLVTGAMDQLGLIYMGDTMTDYSDDDLLTDIALRLSEQNGQLAWRVYEPRDGEGRIPEDEKDVEIMWEALKMAAKKASLDRTVRCNSCGIVTPTLKKCSQCQQVSYCTKECQKTDWKTHKVNCKKQ